MNKQEQIKFIEDNYPLTTNHISNRRIRHSIFSKIETELQAYLLGFYAADGSIDEKRKTLIGERTNKTFKIGDIVKIRVIEANKALRKIAFELVEDDENELEEA